MIRRIAFWLIVGVVAWYVVVRHPGQSASTVKTALDGVTTFITKVLS